jgi:hypothetical protein
LLSPLTTCISSTTFHHDKIMECDTKFSHEIKNDAIVIQS